jgi:hypothetical protein
MREIECAGATRMEMDESLKKRSRRFVGSI